MLDRLRLLLDIKDVHQDDTLLAILEMCIEEFKTFCHREDIDKFENLICNMAVFRYNSLGAEGLKSETYSDQKYDYMDDYPSNIVRALKNARKLVTF